MSVKYLRAFHLCVLTSVSALEFSYEGTTHARFRQHSDASRPVRALNNQHVLQSVIVHRLKRVVEWSVWPDTKLNRSHGVGRQEPLPQPLRREAVANSLDRYHSPDLAPLAHNWEGIDDGLIAQRGRAS